MPHKRSCFVVAEDRPEHEIGAWLAALTLLEHTSDVDVRVTRPEPSDAFRAWCEESPRVHLSDEPIEGGWFWNVKPHALTEALDAGYDIVIWIDADIIVTSDRLQTAVDKARSGKLVVTENSIFAEPFGSRDCTLGWGLELGREWPFVINSCVVGCGPDHRPLLGRWRQLIERDDYVALQKRPISARPRYALGDQNVLTALLGSEEFADLPLHVLRQGRDIVQYIVPGAYTPLDRLHAAFVQPPFLVHAQGPKPWQFDGSDTPSLARDAFQAEVSPYRHFARRTLADHGMPIPSWVTRSSVAGRASTLLTGSNPHLSALPSAAIQYYGSALKRAGRWAQRSVVGS